MYSLKEAEKIKVVLLWVSMVFMMLLLLGFVVAFVFDDKLPKVENEEPKAEAAQPALEFNKEVFRAEVEKIKADNTGVVEVKQNNRLIDIVVTDSWYDLQPHEKERVATGLGSSIKKAGEKAELIDKGGVLNIIIVDQYGKKLAATKVLGGWEVFE
jgi:hypothetical protein